jgi:hypothetical protein
MKKKAKLKHNINTPKKKKTKKRNELEEEE